MREFEGIEKREDKLEVCRIKKYDIVRDIHIIHATSVARVF